MIVLQFHTCPKVALLKGQRIQEGKFHLSARKDNFRVNISMQKNYTKSGSILRFRSIYTNKEL